MRIHFVSKLLLFITLELILCSCVSLREGTFHPSAPWLESAVQDKHSISLLISNEQIVNGRRISVDQSWMQQRVNSIAKAYKDSGLFSDVKIGAADTDFRAEVHLQLRNEFSKRWALLAITTLTLTPVYEQHEYIITTKMKDKELQTLGIFEKAARETTWFQLFLIFIMPFNRPNSVMDDLIYDLNSSIIRQVYNSGVLHARELHIKPSQ